MKQEIGRAVTMKTGPNDARCVIWALGKFFYILNCVFFKKLTYILLHIQLLSTKQAIGNDARYIVCALRKFFSLFFFDTTNILLYIYKF